VCVWLSSLAELIWCVTLLRATVRHFWLLALSYVTQLHTHLQTHSSYAHTP